MVLAFCFCTRQVLEASGHFQKSCKKLKEEAKKYKKKVERESKNLEQDRKEQKTDALVEALQVSKGHLLRVLGNCWFTRRINDEGEIRQVRSLRV